MNTKIRLEKLIYNRSKTSTDHTVIWSISELSTKKHYLEKLFLALFMMQKPLMYRKDWETGKQN